MSHDPMFVGAPFRRLLKTVFRTLWMHAREDALQELRLVEWGCRDLNGADRFLAAIQLLIWLDYDLGYSTEHPSFPRPAIPPHGEMTSGTWFDQLDHALAVERVAA